MGNHSRENLRVVFLGNHNVGIQAMKAIRENSLLLGVVAHPYSPEEGIVFESVYEFAKKNGIAVIRGKASDEEVYEFILNKQPDILWVTDYKFLLPKKILEIPKICAINLHPSLLPQYRGRAPINWAIINGEKKIGLTAHILDEGVDTGDIIQQIELEIGEDEYVESVLNRLYPIYYGITVDVLNLIKQGRLVAVPQKWENTPVFPKRAPEDGKIDWHLKGKQIYNLIRAVSRPYPGAFTFIEDKKVIFWKAHLKALPEEYKNEPNGKVLIFSRDKIVIKCSDSLLYVTEWQEVNYAKNISFYTKLIDKYGIDFRSLHWGSRESQELRFQILTEIGNLNGKSVLDVGCGLGDFYEYLRKNNIFVQYKGVDITPKMIEVARERFPKISFEVRDLLEDEVLETFDYVFASGIFYLVENKPYDFMKKMVKKMFEIARIGLAFNSLSAWADSQEKGEFYANPLEVIEFCKTLTTKIVFKHNYHPADFTVFLYK